MAKKTRRAKRHSPVADTLDCFAKSVNDESKQATDLDKEAATGGDQVPRHGKRICRIHFARRRLSLRVVWHGHGKLPQFAPRKRRNFGELKCRSDIWNSD